MYGIIHLGCFFIRQFLLPNPFMSICPESALGYNMILEVVLYPVAYFLSGILYVKHRDGPETGCLYYYLFYFGITIILWGLLSFVN